MKVKTDMRLFLITITTLFSLSCTANIVNNLPAFKQDSGYKGITYEEYKIREKKEILAKIRNKKLHNYNLENLSINTGLLNNNGKTFKLQSNIIRNRKYVSGQHPANDDHTKEDYQYFDFKAPDSLKGLENYEGNSVNSSGKNVSALKINNFSILNIESDVIIIKFKTDDGLSLFKSLYNAEVQEELDGYYKLKIDPDKSPIEKTEEFIEKLNKLSPENVKDIEFSSLDSMKLFAIVCDFLFNHTLEVGNIEFNQFLEGQLPITDVNDWRYPSPAITDTTTNTPINSWWLTSTNVISPFNNKTFPSLLDLGSSAWDYSIGTGVKVSVLDTEFNLSHAEYQRRIIQEIGNDLSSDKFSKNLYHGTEMSMVLGAEKNNGIGSVGVAPNVSIAPYFVNNTWDAARRVWFAFKNGAQIINMSLIPPYNLGFFLEQGLAEILIPGSWESQIINALKNNVTIVASAGNSARPIQEYFPAKMSDINGIIVVGGVDIVPKDPISGNQLSHIPYYTATFEPKRLDNSIDNVIECKKKNHNPLDQNDSCNNFNGKGSGYGTNLVWAPWQDYYWADPINPKPNLGISLNPQLGGTSAAAAFTSGVAALMLSRNPDLSNEDIERILHESANKNNPIHNHEFMNHAPNLNGNPFSDPKNLFLIDARAAIEQAIRENINGRSTEPNDYRAKDLGGGYFDSVINTNNSRVLHFNDGTSKTLIDSFSDEEISNVYRTDALVRIRGWESPITKPGEIEGLEIKAIKEIPNISKVDLTDSTGKNKTTEIRDKGFIILIGTNLFAPKSTKPEIIFRGITSGKDYIFPINRGFGINYLFNEGDIVKFIFDASSAITIDPATGTGTSIPLGAENYKIVFKGTLGDSNEFIPLGSLGFSVLKNDLPSSITNNNQVYNVINDYSKTQVFPNQPVAAQIPTSLGLPLIENTIIKIAGKSVSIKSIIDQYVLINTPPDIPEGAQDVIISIAGGGEITYKEALEIIAVVAKLKPPGPVTFTNGTTLNSEQFVTSGQAEPVKIMKGGLYGIALNGDVNLNDISVFADGHRCTLLDVVQNYALYQISPDVDSGIKNLIIEHAGGGSITLEQALDVLAVSAGIIPNHNVTFPNGDVISPEQFVGSGFKTQFYPGETAAFAFNTKVDINNINIMANGVRCTLRSVVDNYVSFNIPPDIDSGVVNLIIEYAGGGSITLEQALEVLSFSQNLMATYLFDGGGLDTSGNNNHLTYENVLTNGEANFNGSSSIIDLPISIWNNNTQITLCAWVNFATLNGGNVIVATNKYGYAEYDRYKNILDVGPGHSIDFTPALDTWYFVTVQFIHSGNRYFIKMIYDNKDTGYASIISADSPEVYVRLGYYNPIYIWDGKMDSVRIYNKLLSEREIKAVKALGR